MPINNRINRQTTAVNVSENFGAVVDGWTWGASNAGPSSSQITDGGIGAGRCLQLTGGSVGHYEQLQFLGFLDPHGSYALTYALKAEASFASQLGDAGWYLQFFTASGETVRLLVSNSGAATTDWQPIGPVTLNCAALAATLGLNSHVIKVGLLLVNGKYQLDHTTGASLFVTDIGLSGTSTAQAYGYDANGDVTAAPARNLTSLSYEPFSGLVSTVTLTGVEAQSVRYAYGASGLRSTAVTDYGNGVSDKTLYLRDPFGNVLMRRQTQNGVETVTSYLQCRSGLLTSHTDSGNEQYILTDNLGSTRAVINTAGVQDYNYGPYGEVLDSPAGDELPYRYTGQEQDAVLGVDNYNARLYDPALRRFYAPDPAEQYPSPYVYVGNDPISRIDPDGAIDRGAVIFFFIATAASVVFGPGLTMYLACRFRIFCDPGPGKFAMNLRNRIGDFGGTYLSYDWQDIERAAVLQPRTGLSNDPTQLEVYYAKSKKTELLYQAPSYYRYDPTLRKYNYVYFAHSKELRLWEVTPYEMALTRGSYFHSQLGGGKNVDCAGEIYTLRGRISTINTQTGHYYKDEPEFSQCVGEVTAEIERLGYKLPDLSKTLHDLQREFFEDDAEQ